MSDSEPIADPVDKRDEAALLVALDDLTDAEIGARVGVTARTLGRWKHDPEFSAKVQQHLDDFRSKVRRSGLAILENRVARLNADWLRLQKVVEERGADPEHVRAPGGSTGLLVRTLKKIGSGESAETVTEFSVDTGLLAELRQIEKQAAQELGQWVEKKGVEGDPDKPVFVKVLGNVSLDDL